MWFCFSILALTVSTTYSNVFESYLVTNTFSSMPDKNALIATLPLEWSLCKLASISTGSMKTKLLQALDMNTEEVKQCFRSVSSMLDDLSISDLILFNKIYVNYSREVNTSFVGNSTSSYGVGVEFVGFNSPNYAVPFINDKIAKTTYRRVTNVLDLNDITDETKMMIITAAHLKPLWIQPFPYDMSKTRKFYHMNGLVSDEPMMVIEELFDYSEDRYFTTVTLPLRSASMTIVVPKTPKGLPKVLEQLKANPNMMRDNWMRVRTGAKRLVLPRFKIKAEVDLTDLIKNSSLRELLYSNTTGLKDILKEEYRTTSNMFVSKVKQKLFLDIDEFGTTIVDKPWMTRNHHIPPNALVEIVADRPFYFTVDLDELLPRARKGGAVVHHSLLHGVYYGPQ